MEGAGRAWQLPHLTLLRMQRDERISAGAGSAHLVWDEAALMESVQEKGQGRWWKRWNERGLFARKRKGIKTRQRRLRSLTPPSTILSALPSHTHRHTHIPHPIDICQLSDMLTWSCSPKTVSHCRRAVNRPIYPTPSVLKVRVAKTQPSQIPIASSSTPKFATRLWSCSTELRQMFLQQMWPNNIFWAIFTFSFFQLSCLATIVSAVKCAPSPNLPYARWKIQAGIPLGSAQGRPHLPHTGKGQLQASDHVHARPNALRPLFLTALHPQQGQNYSSYP